MKHWIDDFYKFVYKNSPNSSTTLLEGKIIFGLSVLFFGWFLYMLLK
jgi:hypothetical protein